MVRNLTLLVGALVLPSAVSLHAEDAVLGQLYGSGVHAFYSQDYVKSHEYLTTAISGGTQDPRTYYFRGLAYLRLGRGEEAEMDFQKGANLESRDVNRFYNVGKSLERVQGRARLRIETYRVKARLAARQRAEEVRKVRYDAMRAEESTFLQEQVESAPEVPAEIPTPPSAKSTEQDPFGVGPPVVPATEAVVPPAAEPPAQPPVEPGVAPGNENPFEVVSPPAQPPVEPVAQPPAQPAVNPSTVQRPGSVLDAMKRALGKAAGGGQAPPAAPPAANDDPFSNQPSTPPAVEPVPKPAAGPGVPPAAGPGVNDDPFSDEPVPEPPGGPATEPAAGPATEPAAGPATEPAAEPATEPAAGPASQPADDSDNPFADETAAPKSPPTPPTPPAKEPAINPDNPFDG